MILREHENQAVVTGVLLLTAYLVFCTLVIMDCVLNLFSSLMELSSMICRSHHITEWDVMASPSMGDSA